MAERIVSGITSNFDNPLAVYFANSAMARKKVNAEKSKRNAKRQAYVELTTASVDKTFNVESEEKTEIVAIQNESEKASKGVTAESEMATIKSATEIIVPIEILPEMSTLDDYTAYIKGTINRMKQDAFGVCLALSHVKKAMLFKEKGYRDIYAYAESELGFAKDTVNKYVSIVEWFDYRRGTNGSYTSRLSQKGGKDFSVGALIELLPLRNKKSFTAENGYAFINTVNEMIENGDINSDMTAGEIRKVVKAKRSKNSKSKKMTGNNGDSANTGNENVEVNESEIAQKLNRQNEIAKINDMFKTSYNSVKAFTGDNDDMIVMLQAQREMTRLANSASVNTASTVETDNSEIELLKKQLAEMQAENERLRVENQQKDIMIQSQTKTIEELMTANNEMTAENEKLKSNVEVEEKIGEEKIISKGGKILRIVNEKLNMVFKYTKAGSHVWYHVGKQITRDKALAIFASING